MCPFPMATYIQSLKLYMIRVESFFYLKLIVTDHRVRKSPVVAQKMFLARLGLADLPRRKNKSVRENQHTEACNALFFAGRPGRRYQNYVYGKPLDCSQWKKDFNNCMKYTYDKDYQAAVGVSTIKILNVGTLN